MQLTIGAVREARAQIEVLAPGACRSRSSATGHLAFTARCGRLLPVATSPLRPFEPDPVIEALKRDVDRTLLRANLALTPVERLRRMQAVLDQLERLRASFTPRSRTP